MTTSTHLPVCVYCSTARPADRTGCPTCGRPWIDVRIGSGEPAVAGTTVVAATEPETTPDSATADSEEPPPTSSNGSEAADGAAVAAAAAVAANESGAPAGPEDPPFDQDAAGNGVHEPIENEDADAPDPVPPTGAAVAAAGATGSSDAAMGVPEAGEEATTTAQEAESDEEPATAPEAESDADDAPAPPPPDESPEPVADAPPPPPPPPPAANDGADWKRWMVPAGLAAAAVIVFGAILFIVLDRGGESEAAPETTTAPTTQAPTTAAAPATTAAPSTTVADPTTTAPTTTSTTTTTTLVPPPEGFEPAGEPIALGDLTLRASAIGPITFGTDAPEAVGRLVSSLGTADETGVAGTELGMCAEGDGIFVRFGDLTVIVSGDAESGTLAGFRYESSDEGSAEPALVTPSGLRVGDTLGSLEGIYSGYKIVYQSVDGELMFQLMEGGEVLLWGPITSTETGGVVTGISSALICPDP